MNEKGEPENLKELRQLIVKMIILAPEATCLDALEAFDYDAKPEENDIFGNILYEELNARYSVCGAHKKYEMWYFKMEEE